MRHAVFNVLGCSEWTFESNLRFELQKTIRFTEISNDNRSGNTREGMYDGQRQF